MDYGLAFFLGIAFQYFTIAPMRGLSFKDGLVAALKADSLSCNRANDHLNAIEDLESIA